MKTKRSFVLAMLLIGLGAAVSAQTEANFLVEANDDGTVTISKYAGWYTDIKIPAAIRGKTVRDLGDESFMDCDLTSVVIPDTVKTIGDKAFYHNELTSVIIGKGVTSIGEKAFSLNELTSVTIPDSVKTIESGAFYHNELTSVVIGNGVTKIVNSAFLQNEQLSEVTLSADVFYAELFGYFVYYWYVCNDRQAGTYKIDKKWAEYENRKEAEDFQYIETDYGIAITGYMGDSKHLSIPDKLKGKPVKYIAGLSRKGLTGLRIPNSVTSIGNAAFSYNQLTSVSIPDSVKSIGIYAFFCNQLTSVSIPDSVKIIKHSAFSNNQLTSVTIGANIRVDEGNVFDGFYNENGKKAGTYTFVNGKWTYKAK